MPVHDFEDFFDSGDFSLWDGTVAIAPSTITAEKAAMMHRTYGANLFDNGGSVYAWKDFAAHKEIWLRFYFRIVTWIAGAGNGVTIWEAHNFNGIAVGGTVGNFQIRVSESVGGDIELTGSARLDIGGPVVTFPLANCPILNVGQTYCIEAFMFNAANPGDNDGGMAVYLDGHWVFEDFTYDNDQRDVGRQRPVCGGTNGIRIYEDAIALNLTERIYPLGPPSGVGAGLVSGI